MLFVRLGRNKFICCGPCQIEEVDLIGGDPSEDVVWWKLLKVQLVLQDRDELHPSR